MLDNLLSTIAPHYCSSCGKIGTLLCQKCKNYIISHPYSSCIICHSLSGYVNLCFKHRTPYEKAWCVSERKDAVEKLIDNLKFERKRASCYVLAELLAARLPELPTSTQIVPIPTAPKNVRLRGYDHMLLVSKRLAKNRNLPITPLLSRRSNDIQHFAPDRQTRLKQAKNFFEINPKYLDQIDEKASYLLVDDIFTSGATINAAANCLKAAGVTNISVAIIARQR